MIVAWILMSCVVCYLVIARPILNFRYYPKWDRKMERSESALRMQYYRSRTVRVLVPAIIALLALWSFHIPLVKEGFDLPRLSDVTTLLITSRWVTVLYETLTITYFIIAIRLWILPLWTHKPSLDDTTNENDPDIRVNDPVTPRERTAWLLSSIVISTAGQFLLVAFLITYFKMLLPGWWIGSIVGGVAAINGLLVMYAGRKQVFIHASFSLLYCTLYVVTHSLLIPILLEFLFTGYFAVYSPAHRKAVVRKFDEKARTWKFKYAVIMAFAVASSFGLNTILRDLPVDTSVMLQYDASYWLSLNNSQRVQVVERSIKTHHYHGAMTPQQIITRVNDWQDSYQGELIFADAFNSAQSIDTMIQISIMQKEQGFKSHS